jgi:archaemetzincin
LESKKIILITYGEFEADYLLDIAEEVGQEFGQPVVINSSRMDLKAFFDRDRRQYDGNRLLREIDSLPVKNAIKKVGLFRVDLFIPILTYIFGQAIYRGDTGIASLYRLKNEQYGMPPDEDLLYERFRKVIIHELGHTFGLVHCLVPNCVMRSSTYVEDIDQKRHHLCSQCREKLGGK